MQEVVLEIGENKKKSRKNKFPADVDNVNDVNPVPIKQNLTNLARIQGYSDAVSVATDTLSRNTSEVLRISDKSKDLLEFYEIKETSFNYYVSLSVINKRGHDPSTIADSVHTGGPGQRRIRSSLSRLL